MKHVSFRPGSIDADTIQKKGLRIAPDRGIPLFGGALILEASEYRTLQRVNLTISRCLQRAGEYALNQMSDLITVACSHSDWKKRLVCADPCTRLPWATMARLDTIWGGGRYPQMLEYNSGMVEGWGYIHLVQEACRLPAMKHPWLMAYPLPSPLPLVWEAFKAAFREKFGDGEKIRMAILVYPEDSVKSVEVPIFADFLHRQGLDVVIAHPDELEVKGRLVFTRGRKVNLVFKCFGTRDAKENVAKLCLRPFDYDCLALPHPRQTVLGLKFLMALLSDERYENLFGQGDLAILRETVPWTRRVAEEKTTDPEGRQIDLPPYLRTNRSNLVVKESSGSSGRMVTLGWQTTAAEWEAIVKRAIEEGSWVVQQRVRIPKTRFGEEEAGWDCDPYYFLGRYGPVVNRFSRQEILNVFQGGGLAPVMRRLL